MALVLHGRQSGLEATWGRAQAPGLPQLDSQVPPGWARSLENSCPCSWSQASPGKCLAPGPHPGCKGQLAGSGEQEGHSAVLLSPGTLAIGEEGSGRQPRR